MDPAEHAVVDDAETHRFLIVEDGIEAELVYRAEEGRLTLVHTGVPDELGGRGIGSKLVRAALGRARESGETVAPWCPFARKWMQDHPAELAGITVDWSDPPGGAADA